jgi:hypothetical protein
MPLVDWTGKMLLKIEKIPVSLDFVRFMDLLDAIQRQVILNPHLQWDGSSSSKTISLAPIYMAMRVDPFTKVKLE